MRGKDFYKEKALFVRINGLFVRGKAYLRKKADVCEGKKICMCGEKV